MIVFKDLKNILKISIKWENNLKDFYDVIEIALKNKESKEVVVLLRENHVNNLQIIKDICVENYGENVWVRFAPDYDREDLIPIRRIKRESDPEEIFNHILEYEEKMKGFYSSILEN